MDSKLTGRATSKILFKIPRFALSLTGRSPGEPEGGDYRVSEDPVRLSIHAFSIRAAFANGSIYQRHRVNVFSGWYEAITQGRRESSVNESTPFWQSASLLAGRWDDPTSS